MTVTIAPAAGVSADRITLTFDQTTWNTPQTVNVSAPDNAVADGSRIVSIARAVSSSDPATLYGDGSVTAPPVAVTVQDNDTSQTERAPPYRTKKGRLPYGALVRDRFAV